MILGLPLSEEPGKAVGHAVGKPILRHDLALSRRAPDVMVSARHTQKHVKKRRLREMRHNERAYPKSLESGSPIQRRDHSSRRSNRDRDIVDAFGAWLRDKEIDDPPRPAWLHRESTSTRQGSQPVRAGHHCGIPGVFGILIPVARS
jgi:hypothetical protein